MGTFQSLSVNPQIKLINAISHFTCRSVYKICGKMSRLQKKKCLLTYKDPLKRPHISHRKCFLCLGKLQFGYFQLFQLPSVNNKVHKTITTVPTVTISWIKKTLVNNLQEQNISSKRKRKHHCYIFLHLTSFYIFSQYRHQYLDCNSFVFHCI